jgi:hypothetical protein
MPRRRRKRARERHEDPGNRALPPTRSKVSGDAISTDALGKHLSTGHRTLLVAKQIAPSLGAKTLFHASYSLDCSLVPVAQNSFAVDNPKLWTTGPPLAPAGVVQLGGQ